MTILSAVAAALVLAGYARDAAALAAYPWDWSPDEGLSLDYARRVRVAPSTLYGHSVTPFPSAYGPLLPLLLSPVVDSVAPLRWARWAALLWTAAGVAAVYALVRREAPPTLALASAALALCPFDLTFWSMLVRVDGLMVSLWLLAAVPLLPKELRRGADRLDRRRLVAGTLLLLCAVLAKPTAALHGAPLVLGWFLVDRGSALRLAASVGGAGLLSLAGLQWATSGGFVWVSRLWAQHPSRPGQAIVILLQFVASAWPVLLLGALLALAVRRPGDRLRQPALLLLLGGILILPGLSKEGAWWNYLLPALAASAVLAGRWAAHGRLAPLAAPLIAVLALAIAATQRFPLPTEGDERTARFAYSQVVSHVARAGGPLLVSRPDLAYYLVGQPAEIEGSSYPALAAAGATGTERVLARLQAGTYTMVVQTPPWSLPPRGGYLEALAGSYAYAGRCRLGYFFGLVDVEFMPRRDIARVLEPPPDVRCVPGQATPIHDPDPSGDR